MSKPRTGNIQQRGVSSWRIRYVDNNGKRQEETIKGERADAERELAIRLGELAKGLPISSRPNVVLFEELAADVVTDYEINHYKSIDTIEQRFRLHILPVFGKRKAASITTAQLKWYIAQRQQEHAPNGTINRELEAIRHTFYLARDGRKINVWPHVPMLREDNVRSGFFTREDVERLTAQLSEPLASMVWFGFLTGWRLADCRGLLWRNIDFVKGEIRIDVGTDKNRKGRVFPMTTELRSLLAAMLPTNTAPKSAQIIAVNGVRTAAITARVFDGVGDFRKSWATACYKAGLPCVVEPIKIRGHLQLSADGTPRVKVVKALRTFHDLRRSFAREMSNRGVREGAIMKLAGWKTRSVFDRYNIVSEADLKDAVEKMDHCESPSISGEV